MRRTKIVATVGPATRSRDALAGIVEAGADVVRLNAAHASASDHAAAASAAREVAREQDRTVGVLVDLPGPKLRTGAVAGDHVDLEVGQPFALTDAQIEGDTTRVGHSIERLGTLVDVDDEVFLADGEIILRVVDVEGEDVHTRVVRGGTLRSRKGMHLPRAERGLDPFTAADEAALDLATSIKADYVGLSFVRSAADVAAIARRLPKRGPRPQLVPKIETAAALDHLEDIVAAGDAVMVARGDLGIQVAPQRVPLLQKEIIRFCNLAGKPVITATQMLESMTSAPLPTRAEVNDVANAVIDGTDALMLSEETAVGERPTEAVRTMAETAEAAEAWPRSHLEPTGETRGGASDRVAWAVAHAAIAAAEDLDVAAILCPTRSGATARRIASFRPHVPIVGLSSRPHVLGGLALVWGVTPLQIVDDPDHDRELAAAVESAAAADLVRPGDLVAVVAAYPGPRAGSTDYVRIVRA